MTVFEDMNAALVADANLGLDAVWTPAGGAPLAVRLVLEDDADDTALIDGLGHKVIDKTVYSLAVVAAEAVSAGRPPVKGDAVTVAGEDLVISEKPTRDQLQLNWLLSLA